MVKMDYVYENKSNLRQTHQRFLLYMIG